MPFLKSGRQYRSYRRWNHRTRSYEPRVVENIDLEQLDKFIKEEKENIKSLMTDNYYGQETTEEEQLILSLVNWVRMRNYNATKEFRQTKKEYIYEC